MASNINKDSGKVAQLVTLSEDSNSSGAIEVSGNPSKTGDLFTHSLQPTLLPPLPNTAAPLKFVTNAAGFKAFIVKALEPLPAGSNIVVAWSYVDGDYATVAGMVNDKVDELDAPTGTAMQNVEVISNTGDSPNQLNRPFEGLLRARTIGIRVQGNPYSGIAEVTGVV